MGKSKLAIETQLLELAKAEYKKMSDKQKEKHSKPKKCSVSKNFVIKINRKRRAEEDNKHQDTYTACTCLAVYATKTTTYVIVTNDFFKSGDGNKHERLFAYAKQQSWIKKNTEEWQVSGWTISTSNRKAFKSVFNNAINARRRSPRAYMSVFEQEVLGNCFGKNRTAEVLTDTKKIP
mmetsp:Transcript_5770/g.6270  ORF Transcript_5770/g.6270 Transcript_5770/m.6270 type:complete len:178 (-) Transcript_5770:59-592(-)